MRLKRYIEMRGADGGPESHVLALPAFWVGLLYDSQAKAGVLELTRDWTLQEVEAMRDDVRFDPPCNRCAHTSNSVQSSDPHTCCDTVIIC